MGLTSCKHCGQQVLPANEGICPNCHRPLEGPAAVDVGQAVGEPTPIAREAEKPVTSLSFGYWPGIAFLVAAGLAKAIGRAMSQSAVESAQRGGSFIGTGYNLNRAAHIQGTTDIVMIILGVIGIILVIYAAVSRRPAGPGSPAGK